MTEIEKDAEKLKEAYRQKNGQSTHADNLLVETVVKLVERVEILEKRTIRTVVKIKN